LSYLDDALEAKATSKALNVAMRAPLRAKVERETGDLVFYRRAPPGRFGHQFRGTIEVLRFPASRVDKESLSELSVFITNQLKGR
jgi:hypothetical protein